MLDPLGIRLGRRGVEPEGEQQAHHHAMPVPGRLRGGAAGIGEKQAAVGTGFHQPVPLQSPDGGSNRGLGDAEPVGDIHRPGLPIRVQQVGDQFHIVLRHRGAVALAGAREPCRLGIGGGKGAGRSSLSGHDGPHYAGPPPCITGLNSTYRLHNLVEAESGSHHIVTPPPIDGAVLDRPAASRGRKPVAAISGHSLPEVYRSVRLPPASAGWLRKLLAFMGPGYLISVGYMDPGNWATALAGGSAFGYTLLSVALLSSVMAILLQALCARVGIATGRDLAQLCRERFSPILAYPLWLLAEVAICATDLAELIGTAIALDLLFGIPLLFGVLLTAADSFLILWLQGKGVRWLEAFIVGVLLLIFGCFIGQIALSQPEWGAVLRGYLPSMSILTNETQLYIAIGIIGATVMPHNLYLHTALIQSRAFGEDVASKREAVRFASLDSTIALTLALLVNSAILITAAAVFHAGGRTDVAEISEAYRLLSPMVGVGAAAILFAGALLLCGLNATVTATLAGQVVMEGFLRLRLPPVQRRLLTRAIAIIPAVVVTAIYGASGTAKLLVLSQVILSLQLPFAVVPLMLFASDRARLGALATPRWQLVLGWATAGLIIALNLKLMADAILG